jgi:hypothetical protein
MSPAGEAAAAEGEEEEQEGPDENGHGKADKDKKKKKKKKAASKKEDDANQGNVHEAEPVDPQVQGNPYVAAGLVSRVRFTGEASEEDDGWGSGRGVLELCVRTRLSVRRFPLCPCVRRR